MKSAFRDCFQTNRQFKQRESLTAMLQMKQSLPSGIRIFPRVDSVDKCRFPRDIVRRAKKRIRRAEGGHLAEFCGSRVTGNFPLTCRRFANPISGLRETKRARACASRSERWTLCRRVIGTALPFETVYTKSGEHRSTLGEGRLRDPDLRLASSLDEQREHGPLSYSR